jgi:hypothetical protein
VEQAYAHGQIMAAYWLERMARAFMGGRQCTGILMEKRLFIVEHASNALDIRRIWRSRPTWTGRSVAGGSASRAACA